MSRVEVGNIVRRRVAGQWFAGKVVELLGDGWIAVDWYADAPVRSADVELDWTATTSTVIHYAAANGHVLAYYEDANQPGKPGRAAAHAAWHSEQCRGEDDGPCREALPDY